MGSVKTLLTDAGNPGASILALPKGDALGLGAWEVSGRFSVADLKKMIPPQEIENKKYALAMGASRYWEVAANAGFASAYVGMLDKNNEIVDTQTLLARGELSSIVVMRLAVTPQTFGALTAKTRKHYHDAIKDGEFRTYVADAECIFRFGFPLGSSTFKKIFAAAGMADRYERLSTYNETVAALDEIRAIADIMSQPLMKKVLADAGLDRIPNPGYIMDRPVLNFDTKFDPTGDRPMTFAEAQSSMNLDNLRFNGWLATLTANAFHQREFCEKAGLFNLDGKTEALVIDGYSIFSDFACTVDENRLMIGYRPSAHSPNFLIPANKEIQRAVFRSRGIYAAKEEAIRDHGDDWQEYMGQYVTQNQIEDATAEAVWMMEQAISTVGNQLLGRVIFGTRSIEEWVGSFLPYASVEEHDLAT